MQIQYAKNLSPGKFELGTSLSWPSRSIFGKTVGSRCGKVSVGA